MHVFGAVELDITTGNSRQPSFYQGCPSALDRGEDGRLFVTPDCISLEELEGESNSLQDELDEIRE